MKDRRTKDQLLKALSEESEARAFAEDRVQSIKSDLHTVESKVASLKSENEKLLKRMTEIKHALTTAAAMKFPGVILGETSCGQVWRDGQWVTIDLASETEELRLVRLLYSLCSQ